MQLIAPGAPAAVDERFLRRSLNVPTTVAPLQQEGVGEGEGSKQQRRSSLIYTQPQPGCGAARRAAPRGTTPGAAA
eukprot:COSAG01_NODE_10545_length_2135_cov_4.772102_1_plen_75_part_10